MPTNKKTTEHHATMHDSSKYTEFATMKDKGGRGVNFIMGISKKEGPEGGHSEIQSVRFDAKQWPIKKAKQWLKDNNMTPVSFKPATIKEDGEPAITTSTMGDAQYAPKVLPMASHYGDFKKDRFDQSFMASMKRKLNESVVKEEIKGKLKVGDIIADEDGKKFRVDNIGAETIQIIPEDGEYSDRIRVVPSDIYDFYTVVFAPIIRTG